MFTAGTNVLGYLQAIGFGFYLSRNQSLSYLPISAFVGSCCQHMSVILKFWPPGPKVHTMGCRVTTLTQMT